MTWPIGSVDTSAFDDLDDSPAVARANLKVMADKVNAMVATPPVDSWPGRLLGVYLYESAGSYSHVANAQTTMLLVEGVAAGGGSGVCAAGVNGEYRYGLAGGGGAYARLLITQPALFLPSLDIVVGAGGVAGQLGVSSGYGGQGGSTLVGPGGNYLTLFGGYGGSSTNNAGGPDSDVPGLDFLGGIGGLVSTPVSYSNIKVLDALNGMQGASFYRNILSGAGLHSGGSKWAAPVVRSTNSVASDVGYGLGGSGRIQVGNSTGNQFIRAQAGTQGKVIVFEFS